RETAVLIQQTVESVPTLHAIGAVIGEAFQLKRLSRADSDRTGLRARPEQAVPRKRNEYRKAARIQALLFDIIRHPAGPSRRAMAQGNRSLPLHLLIGVRKEIRGDRALALLVLVARE